MKIIILITSLFFVLSCGLSQRKIAISIIPHFTYRLITVKEERLEKVKNKKDSIESPSFSMSYGSFYENEISDKLNFKIGLTFVKSKIRSNQTVFQSYPTKDTVNYSMGGDKYYDARDDENVLFGISDSSSDSDGEDSFIHEMRKVMAQEYYKVKVKAGEACVDFLKQKVNVAVAKVKEDIKQSFIELGKLKEKTEQFDAQCKKWEGNANFDELREILLKNIKELKKEQKVITDKLAVEDESIRETYNARFAKMMNELKIRGDDLSEVMAMWKTFVDQDHVAKLD